MIKLVRLKELNIQVYQLDHTKCNYRSTFYLAPQYGSVLGIKCKNCGTILWFDNWENKIMNKARHINPQVPTNEYLEIKSMFGL